MKVRITTITDVNIRNGPGMIYEIRERAKKGTTYTSLRTSKDANGILWYKVSYGWICSQYVTLDTNKQAMDVSPGSKLKVAEGDTVAVGNDSYSGTSTVNSGLGGVSDAVSGNGDVILGRRIFGVPYQYLPTTDLRVSSGYDQEIGVNFSEMIAELPVLSVLPGVPMFMPDLDDSQKEGMLETLVSKVEGISETVERKIKGSLTDKELRYFSFTSDFPVFVHYFNTLCQINAIMMGIGDEPVPGAQSSDDVFKYFDWSKYTLSMNMAGRANQIGYATSGASNGPSATAQKMANDLKTMSASEFLQNLTDTGKWYTDFVVKPNINYQETLGNAARESAMAGMFNQMSDMTRELQFIMNTSQLVSEEQLAKSKQSAMETLQQGANHLGSSFVNRFLKGASSVLSGTNIVFPQIWGNSSFNRSYTIEIPLYTPYGSIKNIFMDILVPTWFWIAISAPHQASANSYSAPFLIKCNIPGIFSVDMGMVESLNITKGVDNEWSVDGFPMAVNLQITINDLYSHLYVSRINGFSPNDVFNFLQNNALIDYLAVNSGLDMKYSEWDTKLKVADALISGAPGQLANRMLAELEAAAAKKVSEISQAAGIAGAAARKYLPNII